MSTNSTHTTRTLVVPLNDFTPDTSEHAQNVLDDDDAARVTEALRLLRQGFTEGTAPNWRVQEDQKWEPGVDIVRSMLANYDENDNDEHLIDEDVASEDITEGDWFYREANGEVSLVQVRRQPENGHLLAQFGEGVYLLEHLLQGLAQEQEGQWRRAELPRGWATPHFSSAVNPQIV